MKLNLSKTGAVVAGIYLLIAITVLSPLLLDGYIGHGNGVAFLIAIVTTSPLSFLILLVDDLLTDANAFYMTGCPYYRTLCELAAGAVFNTGLVYALVSMLQRKLARGRAG
jgi:hypothetical protein